MDIEKSLSLQTDTPRAVLTTSNVNGEGDESDRRLRELGYNPEFRVWSPSLRHGDTDGQCPERNECLRRCGHVIYSHWEFVLPFNKYACLFRSAVVLTGMSSAFQTGLVFCFQDIAYFTQVSPDYLQADHWGYFGKTSPKS